MSHRVYGNLCLAGTKVYIIGHGHMTKMAAMSIYGKNPLQIFFFRTISQMTLKLGTQQKGFKHYRACIIDNLGLFYNKVNFVHLGFNI